MRLHLKLPRLTSRPSKRLSLVWMARLLLSPGKVVDFAAVREGAARDKTPDQQAAKPRRGRRGDDKRKVAMNPQTMGNYKKIKSITLRMEPSGTTWAAFLRGQAGKEEIY